MLLSGRFDGKEKEAFLRAMGSALEKLGCEILVVEAADGGVSGEKVGQRPLSALSQMDVMVAFAFDDYGEKTSSARNCSYFEVKYAIEHSKPVVPLQLYEGDWPPAGGGPGTPGYEPNQRLFTATGQAAGQAHTPLLRPDPEGRHSPVAWDLTRPEACAKAVVHHLPKALSLSLSQQLEQQAWGTCAYPHSQSA